ncbi:MAG: formate dehydrogenase subunit gamma [Hyphomicrobiaceae bacterium]
MAWFARATLTLVMLAILGLFATSATQAQQQHTPSVRPPAGVSQDAGTLPGGQASGGVPQYDSEMWRRIRQTERGTVALQDPNAAILVDSSGETWRLIRKNEYMTWGAYGLAGVVALLVVFYLIRGRIKISSGLAGTTIQRFTDVERATHWLLAISFIFLALSGLNLIYGRYVLLPLMGKEAFASLTLTMKYLHNYVGFAFMVGVILTLLIWVRHNVPSRHDAVWLAQGGGLLTDAHPPARKFNAGQKILFWLVVFSGFSLSLSGLALLFPHELPLFAKTFEALNIVAVPLGMPLPTDLTANQEQQLATLWHGILAIVMSMVVIAHIYIGSIGMQGAFSAMGSGQVDLNWAKEHHSLWVEEVLENERSEVARAAGGRMQPAE